MSDELCSRYHSNVILYTAILLSFLAFIFPKTDEATIMRTIHFVITSIACLSAIIYMLVMLDYIETMQRNTKRQNRVYYDNTSSESDDLSWSDVFSSSDD